MKENAGTSNKARRTEHLTPAQVRKQKWNGLIVDLYLKGHSYNEIKRIALETTNQSFSRPFVARVVEKATEQWVNEKQDFIAQHKAVELAKINKLEGTYWEAWERSLRISKSTTETKVKPKDGSNMKVNEVQNTKKESNGEAKFLQGVQWCIDKRCLLLGVETPQVAVQINNNNDGKSSSSTTIVRRVVFKTRETTAAPQVIQNTDEE